ncbi:30S ribosome-binding factor RbfA [Candidatus Legionella polyplacis]|uniref:Ribosome-binding factor A n=1 Tax=Candidatus Legionella polyplacis TaxID=2005262 RepID=A0ABZ2GW91_9GAMM
MNSDFKRVDRIASVIQRELSILIYKVLDNPKLPKFISITFVKVSKDLSYTKVYFTVCDKNKDLAVEILNHSANYLRHKLSKLLSIYTVPKLCFIYDKNIEYSRRLLKLIENINIVDRTK